jgi:hypothetical protein
MKKTANKPPKSTDKDLEPTAAMPAKEGTVTLSVRVTEEQHELLVRASRIRGWNPTSLLRVAALERAAHIINTSTDTAVLFTIPALRVASTLTEVPTAYTLGPDGDSKSSMQVVDDVFEGLRWGGPDDPPPVEIRPRELTVTEWEKFERAAKLGGAEFLNMVVRACKNVRQPPHIPEPIDPSTFSDKE